MGKLHHYRQYPISMIKSIFSTKFFQSAAFLSFVVGISAPWYASAAGVDPSYLQGYASSILDIINGPLLAVVIALAFITFLWGVYKYFILGASSESEKKEGRSFVMWGLIGFVIIFSLWGILAVITGTFNLPTGGVSPAPPIFNTGSPSSPPPLLPSSQYPSPSPSPSSQYPSSPQGPTQGSYQQGSSII